MPSLFAISDKVIGNLQMALFASFGSFATLVLANFGGTRRDKLIAHAGLALAGSALLTIGTLVNSSVALAVIVTVPVTFAVFFAGVCGANAASGGTAALLAYVLPAASPGTFSMVPDRLAGWWLASVVGTVAVLASSPPGTVDRVRVVASRLAHALADELDAVVRGEATEPLLNACIEAKQEMLAQFSATPVRSTDLANSDQALANTIELLEWCTALLADTVSERDDLSAAPPYDRDLLEATAATLRDTGSLFVDGTTRVDLERLEECRQRSLIQVHRLEPGSENFGAEARVAFHAHALAVTTLAIGADALIAARLVDSDWIVETRARWFGLDPARPPHDRRFAGAVRYTGLARSHASVRSVWFVNSVRAALALAAAVAVADLLSVQHAFWVVLGTLSVLRASAASTGSTAIRALLGTAAGFAIGAALLLVIGTGSGVLWAALPIAVFVAAYAPGAAPFAVGQAAFTVTIAVLFNLLVPVGWRVGVIRIEDVALGCAVSIVVGILFWPRGVASVVGDDLADAFRLGAAYLSQAVEWVSGVSVQQPTDAAVSVTAGERLEEALRAYLADQGTKHVKKEDLWRLVGGTLRLRLTARAVAVLPRDADPDNLYTRGRITHRTEVLRAWFERLAALLDRPHGQPAPVLAPPVFSDDGRPQTARSRAAVWLCEDLDHLVEHLGELVAPAERVAEIRRRPWWR